MRMAVDDGSFLVAAFCCRHGMGDWTQVWSFTELEREAYFYAQCRLRGLTIDWSTGEVKPRDGG